MKYRCFLHFKNISETLLIENNFRKKCYILKAIKNVITRETYYII